MRRNLTVVNYVGGPSTNCRLAHIISNSGPITYALGELAGNPNPLACNIINMNCFLHRLSPLHQYHFHILILVQISSANIHIVENHFCLSQLLKQ